MNQKDNIETSCSTYLKLSQASATTDWQNQLWDNIYATTNPNPSAEMSQDSNFPLHGGQQQNRTTPHFPHLREQPADSLWLQNHLAAESLNLQQAEKVKGAGVGNWQST
jgi:hypothetical protein